VSVSIDELLDLSGWTLVDDEETEKDFLDYTEWDSKSTVCHITWFSQHLKTASHRGGGEGLRIQSQEGQDLCAAAVAVHLIFKTSTADQSIDLTNKDMTKDSQRFSPWFHSVENNRLLWGCKRIWTTRS
jgi:hypothetical protein